MKRSERVEIFCRNLHELLSDAATSRAAFAQAIGIDRSTLSQLLSSANQRLPRAETVAAIAEVHQVSADWLLGLSQEGRLGADLVSEPTQIEQVSPSPVDELLETWHREAAGYKIRYVPANLPDLLRTEAVLRFQYRHSGTAGPDRHIEETESRLALQRRPETEMEACQSVQSLRSFARGEGVWHELPKPDRRAQLEHLTVLVDELYPTFRWFLFDGQRDFSAPFTVFGPLRAAIYMGEIYVVLNSNQHIRELMRRFDDLIRAAVVQPPQVGDFVQELLREMG